MPTDNSEEDTAVCSSWKDIREAASNDKRSQQRKVLGCVSYKDTENWAIAPNIRLCDARGEDVAVFFLVNLNANCPLNDVHVGDVVSILAPHLRPFADGQVGVSIDDLHNVMLLSTQSLTDSRRLQFVELHKQKGDWWVQQHQPPRWESARMNYANGLDLLPYSLPSAAAHERARRLRVELYVRLCESLFHLKQWRTLIEIGDAALPFVTDTNADPSVCSLHDYAMFFYALARAHEEIRDYDAACGYARHAAMFEPNSTVIVPYYNEMQRCREEKNVALGNLMRDAARQSLLRGMHQSFGFRSALLLRNSGTTLDSVRYFVDLHTLSRALNKRARAQSHLRRYLLYMMSSSKSELCVQDLNTLHSELRIKTYICLQYSCTKTVVPYAGLSLMTDAATVSAQRHVKRAGSARRMWKYFLMASDTFADHSPKTQADQSKRKDQDALRSGSSAELCGLMPVDRPAIMTFNVLRLCAPRWLYWICLVLSLMHFTWLCDAIAKLWFWLSEGASSYGVNYGLTDAGTQLLFRILSDASNYPVVIISDSDVQQGELILALLNTPAAKTASGDITSTATCDDRLNTIADVLDLSEHDSATLQCRASSRTCQVSLLRLQDYARPVIDLLSTKKQR